MRLLIGSLPSSIKFLGEWPEDKKNEVITEIETSSTGFGEWADEWMADDADYVTHDELSNAIVNLATTYYVDNAVANRATTDYVDNAVADRATTYYVDNAINNIAFPPSLTEDQVNSLIDAKLGVIENGHY